MVRVLRLAEMMSEEISTLKRRAELDIEEAMLIAKEVINQIKQRGNQALIEYVRKFDYAEATVENLKVSEEEFAAAHEKVDPELKAALEEAFTNIKAVHQRQCREEIQLIEIKPGIFAGEKVTPIASAGLYVPRGKGAFPSVMLMLTIPAMVAGVPRIMVCTPPDKNGEVEPVSLVAAEMAGVKEIYKLGGMQAIAAMALGTETIPKVDKITGPCNVYGSAAKRILFGTVDVGLPAGPSESIILADETTNPQLAALDLLVEAEHGPESAALLVTHSEEVAQKAAEFVPKYLQRLPEWRRNFCEKGLSSYGGILITSSLEESINFVNEYAPEHLEILVKDPFSILGRIKNAGEILLGAYTPIPTANYCLGVNAILPTGGFARSYSAVSVHDFLKRSGIGYLTKEGFERLKKTTTTLADYEGFPAHAMAIREREELLRE
ncbi:MAG: histidinol dehydrogenase [Oscillatoriaceae bacterium SKW80]|nr:histidinol dehydrogenase [Oscillatoriaceae bacterium SKYG93]MCX8120140.1 histidinol dehydrogenase [Oscillatoriaceae bacterium SKW80]MDW8453066.1 histidinol dehydrogenase [Oscillatoriaceae cyanobacterium SKYGB_i_bin93]HIK29023.1 histidinol dehydrogenase [Oscillatoriaceae cyanobacterium M7585_C2015_266]